MLSWEFLVVADEQKRGYHSQWRGFSLHVQYHADPLILHFRIMSNNCKMYTNFANLFVNNINLNSRTLGKKYAAFVLLGDVFKGVIPILLFDQNLIISPPFIGRYREGKNNYV